MLLAAFPECADANRCQLPDSACRLFIAAAQRRVAAGSLGQKFKEPDIPKIITDLQP